MGLPVLSLEAARLSLRSTPPTAKGSDLSAEVLNRRLLDLLIEERALHGHGSAAEIDAKVGRTEGYLGRVLRGEIGLQTEMLFRVLNVLEVDPSAFFAAVVGLRFDPRICLHRLRRSLANVAESPSIALADNLWQRLQQLAKQQPHPSGETSPEEPWLDDLSTVDEQRFSDPATASQPMVALLRRALRQAEAAPQVATARHALARALGVAASIERLHAVPRRAARLLDAAFALLEDTAAGTTSLLYAELLERACYQLADPSDDAPGDDTSAVELALQATEIHLRRGHLAGVGRCLVVRAVVAYRRGQCNASLDLYRAALRYLPPSAWQNRFAAWQGRGLCHLQLGDLAAAEACAQRAADVHLTGEGLHWWRLRWLQAEIAYRRGDLERAERWYRRCQGAFDDADQPRDVAQLAMHLTKVLLAAHKMPQVRQVAAGCMALLKPLQQHKEIRALLEELARRALTSELTLPWLEKAAQTLDRTPDRRADRSVERRADRPVERRVERRPR